MPECVGDVFGLDVIPSLIIRVIVTTYRCIWWGPVLEVAVADPSKGFGPTDEFVVGAGVSDLFAFDGILLVIEREVSFGDQLDVVQVMQRCPWRGIGGTAYNERDMTEKEGFGPGVVRAVEVVAGVLRWSHEPEESDDAEVDDMELHGAMLGIFGSEDFDEGFKDGDVGWVGSRLRTILFLECGHEIREYGIVVFGSDIREAGIWFTQVGDPLSDGSEDLRYGANPDIVLTSAGALAVAVGVDDDVVEAVLDVRDVFKSRVNGEGVAELGPSLEILAGGNPGSRDIGRRGGLERSAVVSREASSAFSFRSRQGLACG